MLEREKEKAINRDIQAAVKKAREFRSDFLGLGERLYEDNPDAWRQVRSRWNEEWLPRVEVRVSVTSKIKQSGITVEPVTLH